MTTDEQRAKWLKTWVANGAKFNTSPDVDWFAATPDVAEKISAAITAEAVAAERSRVAKGAGITDAAMISLAIENEASTGQGTGGDWVDFRQTSEFLAYSRALIAEATARERERCARWHDRREAHHQKAAVHLASEGNYAEAADVVVMATENSISAAAHRAGEE